MKPIRDEILYDVETDLYDDIYELLNMNDIFWHINSNLLGQSYDRFFEHIKNAVCLDLDDYIRMIK